MMETPEMMENYIKGRLFGIPVMIATHKVRKKTHPIKLIDWVFKKIYGYVDESFLPDGTDIICTPKVVYVRDEETLEKLKSGIKCSCSHEVFFDETMIGGIE